MPRPRTAGDYQDGIIAASRASLAEAMTALGAYREALVLVGGVVRKPPRRILRSGPLLRGSNCTVSLA